MPRSDRAGHGAPHPRQRQQNALPQQQPAQQQHQFPPGPTQPPPQPRFGRGGSKPDGCGGGNNHPQTVDPFAGYPTPPPPPPMHSMHGPPMPFRQQHQQQQQPPQPPGPPPRPQAPFFASPKSPPQPRFAFSAGQVPPPPPCPGQAPCSPVFDRGLPPPDPPTHATFDVALQKPEGAKLGVEVLPVSEGEHCELAVRRITKGGVVDVWNQLAEEVSKILPGDRITKVNGISHDVHAMARELQSGREIALLLTRRNPNISSVGPSVHGNNAVANASSSNHAVVSNNTGGPTAINHANNGSYSRTANSNTSNSDAIITQAYDNTFVVSFDVELEKRPGEELGMEVVVLTGDAFNGLIVDRILQGGCVDRWNMRSRSPYRIQSLDIIRVNGATATQGLLNTANDFCIEAQRITFTVQRFANRRRGDRPAPTSVVAHRSRISNVLEGLVSRDASMTNDAPRQHPRDGAARTLAASLVPPPPPPLNTRAPWSAPPPPSGDAAPPPALGAGDATDGQPARPAVEPPIIPSAARSMPAEAGPPRQGMSLAQALKMAAAPAPSAPPAPVFGNRGSSAAQPDAAAPTRKWVPKQPPEHKADDFTDNDASLTDSNDLSSSTQGSKNGDGQAEAEGSYDQSEDVNEAEAAVAAAPADSPEADEGGAAPSASAQQDLAADEPALSGASDPSDATGLAPGASAKLLFRTAQLDDEDFVRLLKTALSQRPGLSAFVARAIKLLKE